MIDLEIFCRKLYDMKNKIYLSGWDLEGGEEGGGQRGHLPREAEFGWRKISLKKFIFRIHTKKNCNRFLILFILIQIIK